MTPEQELADFSRAAYDRLAKLYAEEMEAAFFMSPEEYSKRKVEMLSELVQSNPALPTNRGS